MDFLVDFLMDFLHDSLEDEILLQANDSPANAPVNVPVTHLPASEPLASVTGLPNSEPPASDLEPVPSPTSSLPIGDLAIQSPQERGKGKPREGNRLSQEPVDPQITIHKGPGE